jgi:hypothetical protein
MAQAAEPEEDWRASSVTTLTRGASRGWWRRHPRAGQA